MMCEHHTHSLETPFENLYCPIGIICQTMEGTHYYSCFMYISQHIYVFNIQFTVAITWETIGMIECMSS